MQRMDEQPRDSGAAGSGAKDPAGSGAKDPAGSGAKDPAGSGAKDPAGSGAKDPAGSGAKDPAGPGAGNFGAVGPGAKGASGPEYRSAWWFALPIVLGVLGAAIAWSKTRDSDPDLAKWAMIVGLAQTVAIAGGFGIVSQIGETAFYMEHAGGDDWKMTAGYGGQCGDGYYMEGDACEPEASGLANPGAGESAASYGSNPCGDGYYLMGDICEPAPTGYVETRSECEMAVESMEAAGVEQDFMAEIEKCRRAGG